MVKIIGKESVPFAELEQFEAELQIMKTNHAALFKCDGVYVDVKNYFVLS
jgi:hypothetical protein